MGNVVLCRKIVRPYPQRTCSCMYITHHAKEDYYMHAIRHVKQSIVFTSYKASIITLGIIVKYAMVQNYLM